MNSVPDSFTDNIAGTTVHFGRGQIEELDEILAERGYRRGLVVCGRSVGSNEALMRQIESGGGERLVGVFDETTPAKLIETVAAGVSAVRETDADVLIGIGGGSSLDIARQIGVFVSDGRDPTALRSEARESGTISSPHPEEPVPVIVIPTTLPGADLSGGGSIEVLSATDSPTGQPIRTGGSNRPVATIHDPALLETTPHDALTGSAMNGFNKGIETIAAPESSPVSHATAIHGLRHLVASLPQLEEGGDALDRALAGLILVQVRRRIGLIHAAGHGFARRYPVQQGVIHGIMGPHVLRFIFDRVDGNRHLIAEGLGINTANRSRPDIGDAIVGRVERIRAELGLPTRLRELSSIERTDFPAIAEFILKDPATARSPPGLDPSVTEIEELFEKAW